MEGIKNLINQAAGGLDLNFQFKMPQFDLRSDVFQLLGLVTAILVAACLINFLLSHTFLGQRYRFFVAPGVILHEIAHAFFCMLTGAKIKKIALFEKEGGHVEHEPSKLPVLGPILISFAPFLFGAAAIYFLSKYVGIQKSGLELTIESVWQLVVDNFRQLDTREWRTWIILYLVLSIAVTMTPSRKDLENVFSSLAIISIILFLVFRFTTLSMPQVQIPGQIFILLNSVLTLLILSLILSMIIYVLSFGIKRR